jgi:hypothetical protein
VIVGSEVGGVGWKFLRAIVIVDGFLVGGFLVVKTVDR